MKSKLFASKTFSVNCKRRGVSEIIVTLLLLVVTIIGSVFVFSVFQSAGTVEQITGLTGQTGVDTKPSIKLIGHDTRDFENLANINGLNNTNDGKLCGSASCTNELIVLYVRNIGTNEFFLNNVHINEVPHQHDASNAGSTIDSSNEPQAGTFKVISISDPTILASQTIQAGGEARIVIKLDDTVGDIPLNEEMRVLINPTGGRPAFHIVPAGSLN